MPTIRQHIADLLATRAMSARDLSRSLGIREKEVYTHLDHVAQSVRQSGRQLQILPFRCLACGYRFTKRKRYHRPSRCPQCRSSRIETPFYLIV
jgi:hypothetical protein